MTKDAEFEPYTYQMVPDQDGNLVEVARYPACGEPCAHCGAWCMNHRGHDGQHACKVPLRVDA